MKFYNRNDGLEYMRNTDYVVYTVEKQPGHKYNIILRNRKTRKLIHNEHIKGWYSNMITNDKELKASIEAMIMLNHAIEDIQAEANLPEIIRNSSVLQITDLLNEIKAEIANYNKDRGWYANTNIWSNCII